MELNSINNINDFYSKLQNSYTVRYYEELFRQKKIKEYSSTNNRLKLFLTHLKPIVYLYQDYMIKKKKQILGNSLYDYAKEIFSNKEEYIKLYNLLSDEESKDTLLDILKYRISFDRDYLNNNVRPASDQYLDSQILHFTDSEVIADCGAYYGENCLSYYKYMKTAKKYYLIEPIPLCISTCKKNFSRENFKNIEYCQVATGDENTEANFNFSIGGGSSFTNDSSNTTKICKLDDLIKEKLTYLKMDIEGSESSTLAGCINQIKTYKPKLAICAYHKPGDLWKLATQILEYRNDYKIYLRLYQSGFCEAVLYFI